MQGSLRETDFRLRGASVVLANVYTSDTAGVSNVGNTQGLWWRDTSLDVSLPRGDPGADTISLGNVYTTLTTPTASNPWDFHVPCDDLQFEPNRALVIGNNGRPIVSDVTAAEVDFLQGLPGNLDGYQPKTISPQVFYDTLPANAVVEVSNGTFRGIVSAQVATQVVANVDFDVAAALASKQPKLVGSLRGDPVLSPSEVAVTLSNGALGTIGIAAAQLEYLQNVSADISVQLRSKEPLIVGAGATLVNNAVSNTDILITTAQGYVLPVASNIESIANLRSSLADQVSQKELQVTGAARTVVTDTFPGDVLVVSSANGALQAGIISKQVVGYLSDVREDFAASLATKQPNITGAVSGDPALVPGKVVISNASGKLATSGLSSSVLKYLDAPSNVANYQPKITGSGRSLTHATLPATKVLVTLEDGAIGASGESSGTLRFLANLSEDVQQSLDTKQPKIVGSLRTAARNVFAPGQVVFNSANALLVDGVSTGVLNAIANVSADIQGTLDASEDTLTGAVSGTLLYANAPANVVLATDAQGKLTATAVPKQTLEYLSNVTGDIHVGLQNKEPKITGAATTVLADLLPGNSVAVSNATGYISATGNASVLDKIKGIRVPDVQAVLEASENLVVGSARSVVYANLDPSKVVVVSNGELATFGNAGVLGYLKSVTDDLAGSVSLKQPKVTGSGRSVVSSNLAPDQIVVTLANNALGATGYTSVLPHLADTTSDVQSQLLAKQPRITGSLRTATHAQFAGNQVVVTTANGAFSVTSNAAKLDFLDYPGDIQESLNAKQPKVSKNLAANLGAETLVITGADANLASSSLASDKITHVAHVTSDLQSQLDAKAAAFTGSLLSISSASLPANKVVVTDASGNLKTSNLKTANLGYLQHVTSNIGASLANKQNIVTGAASMVTLGNLTPLKLVVTDADGKLAASAFDAANLAYLANVTQDIAGSVANKATRFTGSALSFTNSNLSANAVLVTDAQGNIAANFSAGTLTYVDVSTDVQAQIDGFQNTVTGPGATIAFANFATANVLVVSAANGSIDAASDVPSSALSNAHASLNIQTQLDAKQPLLTSGTTLSANGITVLNNAELETVSDAWIWFGRGTSGNFAGGQITLSNDVYYGNCVLGPTDYIRANGFRIFVSGVLDFTNASNGAIRYDGNPGVANVGGASAVNVSNRTFGGVASAGGNGGNANATPTAPSAVGNGVGPSGGAGGAGAVAGAAAAGVTTRFFQILKRPYTETFRQSSNAALGAGAGGGGGGGGSANSAATGGGGGSGGGAVFVAAKTIKFPEYSSTRYITAVGGAGADGGNTSITGNTAGGGGGGGGGGWITVVYANVVGNAMFALDASGGAAGNGGLGTDGATSGTGGTSGGDGVLAVFDVRTKNYKRLWGAGNYQLGGFTGTGRLATTGGIARGSLFSSKYADPLTITAISVARRLYQNYRGPLIRVRDDANVETDIYANGSALDVLALANAAGTGNAYVVIAYDQSGNDRHAIRPGPRTAQPRIVANGVLDTLDVARRFPGMYFLSSLSTALRIRGFESMRYRYSAAARAVFRPASTQFGIVFGHIDYGASYYQFAWNMWVDTNAKVMWGAGGTTSFAYIACSNVSYTTSNAYVSEVSVNKGRTSVMLNNSVPSVTVTSNTAFTSITAMTIDLAIGAQFNNAVLASPFTGQIAECVVSSNVSLFGNYDGYYDDVPAAEDGGWYSLSRTLVSGYSGPLFRVRSDANTYTDVYAENGSANTSSVTALCGSANGYIQIVYDQSGSGRHFIQHTPSRQPLVYANGILNTFKGRPAARFTGNAYLQLADYGYSANEIYVGAVINTQDANAVQTFVGHYDANANLAWAMQGNVSQVKWLAACDNLTANGVTQTAQTVVDVANGMLVSFAYSDTFTGLAPRLNADANTYYTLDTDTISVVDSGDRTWPPIASFGNTWPESTCTANGYPYGNGSYVVTASGRFSGAYNVHQAVDGNPATEWRSMEVYSGGNYVGTTTTTVDGSPVSGSYVELRLPVKVCVSGVALRKGSSGGSPVAWTLAGSNDNGSTWTSVYSTETNVFTSTYTNVQITTVKDFYEWYRLIVRSASTGTYVSIADVRLVEYPGQDFPPSKFTSSTTTFSGLVYGNGSYAASASFGNAVQALDPQTSWVSNSTYDANGNYVGSASTTIGGVAYPGEWIQLDLPFAVTLRSYSFGEWSGKSWTLAGSKDGITWTAVDARANSTNTIGPNSFGISSNVLSYSYFRLCANAVQVSQTSVSVASWKLSGVPYTSFLDFPPISGSGAGATGAGVTYSGQLYGNGFYGTTWSSQRGSFYLGGYILNNSAGGSWAAGINTYDIYTGYCKTAAATTIDGVSYSGEWIRIAMPMGAVRLVAYSMVGSSESPRNFVLAASNDDATWTALDQRVDEPFWTSKTWELGMQPPYAYYRLCINRKWGGDNTTYVDQIRFYAKNPSGKLAVYNATANLVVGGHLSNGTFNNGFTGNVSEFVFLDTPYANRAAYEANVVSYYGF